ncbi:MAG TPA: hypothetical protein PLV21_12010 [Cyclobacteriaceae bacterium]|nr:hypothetical protein [Cyclobacteriaceae bacterium]
MKTFLPILSGFLLIALMVFDSCSSGKKSFVRGNYYNAVITSTNRLRRDQDHKKSIETLREAYPLAVTYYDDQAKAALASNAQFKWSNVVNAYTTINVMYDEIRRSPGALRVIPNPISYYDKLAEAKQQAAAERYNAGVMALAINNRDKAKEAYRHFQQAEVFVPGYKDVQDMLKASLWAATVKVLVEPIPVQARNISVSAEFFNDKVSEFLHSTPINEFVKFYTLKEAQTINLTPDHVVKIAFDDFAVGEVFLYEKEYALVRDSIVLATYVTQSPGGAEKPVDGTDKPKDAEKPVEKPRDEKPKDPVDDKKEDPKDQPKEDQPKDDKKDDPKDDKPKDPDPLPGDDDFEEKTDEKDRVTVCHIPPGNPAAKHTLTISKNALNAHLAHGDVLGTCEDQKGKNPADKKNDNKGKGSGNGGAKSVNAWHQEKLFYALTDKLNNSISISGDTVKVYGSVKATYYYSRKTTTSKGTVNFQILELPGNRILSVEKMPGEFVWVSEWATFNGDERALTPRQLEISKQKEQLPPQPQELFIAFTRPIYDQLITKLREFYKNY